MKKTRETVAVDEVKIRDLLAARETVMCQHCRDLRQVLVDRTINEIVSRTGLSQRRVLEAVKSLRDSGVAEWVIRLKAGDRSGI